MLIAIDGNEANTKEKVGVSTYAYELLWGLYRLNNKRKTSNNFLIYLKDDPCDSLPKENLNWKYKVIRGKKNWILTSLMPSLLRNPKADIFFTPTHYLPPLAFVPKVFTIHDLGYLDFSGQFRKYDFWQLKYWTAISVIVSKYIIAVSESTKKDIVRRYPFASKKVAVIHHGYDRSRFNTEVKKDFVRRVKNKYSIDGDYILFLSTLKPSKNIEGLLRGFNLIKDKFPKINLVIAGKKGWLYESIYKEVNLLGLKDRVVFTDYVKEEEKPALFSGAKIFALPSFWEGFGMDILNALSCGTPVVVSNVASLPEVAGKAGIYVDPKSDEDISRGLMKALSLNDVEYNRFVRKGLEQVKNFSWEKTALKTMEVLERIK